MMRTKKQANLINDLKESRYSCGFLFGEINVENLIILVDANSIGYAAQHAIKLYSGSMQTQAVFSFIKTMRELRQRYPHAGMVVLWDGRAEWRFEREPSYKSNRKSDPRMQQEHDAYKAQCPLSNVL